jgi:hypothetical protein
VEVELRNAYKILSQKTEGKRPFGRRRHSWKENVKTDLKQGVRVWTEFKWFL